MDKYQWLKEAMNGETINELANKAGISSATAWRQFNNDLNFTAENVILIARAYHKDPVEALVAFDYLRDDERGTASSAPHSKTPPTTTCSPRSPPDSTATHRSPTSRSGRATPRASTVRSPPTRSRRILTYTIWPRIRMRTRNLRRKRQGNNNNQGKGRTMTDNQTTPDPMQQNMPSQQYPNTPQNQQYQQTPQYDQPTQAYPQSQPQAPQYQYAPSQPAPMPVQQNTAAVRKPLFKDGRMWGGFAFGVLVGIIGGLHRGIHLNAWRPHAFRRVCGMQREGRRDHPAQGRRHHTHSFPIQLHG